MQNLWDLCVRLVLCVYFFVLSRFFCFALAFVCGVHTTTDFCFGLMDNPLVIPVKYMCMSMSFFLFGHLFPRAMSFSSWFTVTCHWMLFAEELNVLNCYSDRNMFALSIVIAANEVLTRISQRQWPFFQIKINKPNTRLYFDAHKFIQLAIYHRL